MGLDTAGRNTAVTGEGAGDLDLNQLSVALGKARWWILVPTVIVGVGVTVAVNLVTPRYTAETKLILQSGETTFTRPVSNTTPEASAGVLDERDLGSQALVAASKDVARAAIEALKLRGNPEFDRYAAPGAVRSLLMATGLMRAPTEVQREEALIETFRERLLAFNTGLSRVMTIEFSSVDPELAARGANTVAALFRDAQSESKKQAARTAGSWLLNTIEPLREKVAVAEARVEEFRARKGLLASGPNSTLPQQQLSEMNTQLSTAKSAQADAEAKARLIRDALAAGRPLEISEIANNELVRKLSADRATLRAQVALESRTLLPGHPRMKELTAQLANVEADIRASAEKAVRTLENDSRVQGARVAQLTAALDDLKSRSARANEDEVELRSLEREARTQREQLEAMMARYRDAVARDAKDAVPADARIISTATPPATPSFPKKLPIILVSTMSTLLVGAAIVVTRELLSGRAYVGTGQRMPAPLPVAPIGAEPVTIARKDDEPAGSAIGEDATSERDADATDASEPPVAGGGPDDVPPEAGEGVERAEAVADAAGAEADAEAVTAAIAAAIAASSGTGPLVLFVSDDRTLARDHGYAIARDVARLTRTVLVDLPGAMPTTVDAIAGIGDVVAGRAGFVDVLHRDPASRLHLVAPGTPVVTDEQDWAAALGRCLEALQGTYGCVVACAASPAASAQAQAVAAAATVLVMVADEDLGQSVDAVVAALPPGAPTPLVLRADRAGEARASA
ncbi:MAG: GumC family protein [Burkholderiales bacterium]|nr:GumC family protein [Burkholderiales bacterium]